jgi:hypothetical protein
MEIFKDDDGGRTITLESYSIEREAADEPVTVRAELQISTPTMRPTLIRVRLKYELDDIPSGAPIQEQRPSLSELALGHRIVQLLRNRLAD